MSQLNLIRMHIDATTPQRNLQPPMPAMRRIARWLLALLLPAFIIANVVLFCR